MGITTNYREKYYRIKPINQSKLTTVPEKIIKDLPKKVLQVYVRSKQTY